MIKINDLETCMKTLLASRKISQSELGKRIGHCPAFVSSLTRGERRLHKECFDKICKTLELDNEESEMLRQYISPKGKHNYILERKLDLYDNAMSSIIEEIVIFDRQLRCYEEGNANLEKLRESCKEFRKNVFNINQKANREIEELDKCNKR